MSFPDGLWLRTNGGRLAEKSLGFGEMQHVYLLGPENCLREKPALNRD